MSDRRWPVSGRTLAELRAQPILLPEGIVYQDGWLYVGSFIQQRILRIHLATRQRQVVRDLSMGVPPNGADGTTPIFVKLAISDGTFGPRGTIFMATWARMFGPIGLVPQRGGGWTTWSTATPGDAVCGRGGAWRDVGYGSAVGAGHGRLVYGGAGEGLAQITRATADDPRLDAALYKTGIVEWHERGFELAYGSQGFGFYGEPLPWGTSPAIDYFLRWNGHER